MGCGSDPVEYLLHNATTNLRYLKPWIFWSRRPIVVILWTTCMKTDKEVCYLVVIGSRQMCVFCKLHGPAGIAVPRSKRCFWCRVSFASLLTIVCNVFAMLYRCNFMSPLPSTSTYIMQVRGVMLCCRPGWQQWTNYNAEALTEWCDVVEYLAVTAPVRNTMINHPTL